MQVDQNALRDSAEHFTRAARDLEDGDIGNAARNAMVGLDELIHAIPDNDERAEFASQLDWRSIQ